MSKAEERFRHYEKLMKKAGDQAPASCRKCPYFQPEFKYRSCLYITRKTIDYFCHLLESPEDLKDIKNNDIAFSSLPEFDAIKWAAGKNSPIYKTSYIDILRVAFTYKFKRGRLADLVSLLSGRDFETREFKVEIEEESFKQLHEAVLQAVNQTNYERYLMIVRSTGIVRKSLIRSQNVLNFGYALYLALRERKTDSNKIEHIVRRWIALTILTGRYSGAPESWFDYDIKRFFSYEDPEEYLQITEAGELSDAFWSVNLIQRLNTSVASSPYFNMFLVAQVKAHDKGFLSTQVDIETMLENRGDIHHLFPKKYLTSNGVPQAQYNQIANYAFLQQEINIKISDDAPCVYMAEVLKQCETKQPVYGGITELDILKENLSQNCVPDGFENLPSRNLLKQARMSGPKYLISCWMMTPNPLLQSSSRRMSLHLMRSVMRL